MRLRLQMWQRAEAIARSAPSDVHSVRRKTHEEQPEISLDRSVKPMQRLHAASVKPLGEIAEIIASS